MDNELKLLRKNVKKMNDSIDKQIKSIYANRQYEIYKVKENLLKSVSNDYGLNFKELCKKYITKVVKKSNRRSKKNLIELEECSDEENDVKKVLNENKSESEDKVLEKMVIEDKEFYVDNREGGNIYNSKAEKVGEISGGKPKLFS